MATDRQQEAATLTHNSRMSSEALQSGSNRGSSSSAGEASKVSEGSERAGEHSAIPSSPSLDTDDPLPTSSTLPILPPELWQHIIRLSLPSKISNYGGNRTWPIHSAILRSCSLVNSSWKEFAQVLLFGQVSVDAGRLSKLLEAVADAPELGRRTRVLKLYDEQLPAGLEAVLCRLPNLEELSLTSVGMFDLALLRLLPKLVKLNAWRIHLDFTSPPSSAATPPFTLPYLTEISFCGTTFFPSTAPFFDRRVLPSLRAAAICYSRDSARGADSPIVSRLLDSHLPSLFIPATLNPRSGLPPSLTSSSTLYTLREEALEWHDDTVAVSCGTSTIRHLHLSDLDVLSLEDTFSTLAKDASLKELKTLYLALPREQDERRSKYEAEARKFSRRRGVEVVFVEEQRFEEETLLLPEMLSRHVRKVEQESGSSGRQLRIVHALQTVPFHASVS